MHFRSKIFFLIAGLVLIASWLPAQSIEGVWIFTDHKDGLAKSHVHIYPKEDKLFGRIIEFLPAATLKTCVNCDDELKGKSLLDMDVIYDLVEKDGKWNGRILDPEKNRKYACQISLKDPKTLKIRVYFGALLFGKTLYWEKLQ